MKFSVVRQSFLLAFVSLLALVVVAVYMAPAGVAPADLRAGFSVEELPIAPLGEYLALFEASWPLLAKWIAGFLMLVAGATLARITIRYNLYAINTCLSLPLYGMVMCGAVMGDSVLTAVVGSLLMTWSVKNICLGYRNGFGFDRLFRGAMWLSILVLVNPTAAPLLVVLLFASMQFRRSTREQVVALCGLLLPPLTLCYLNWALGGDLYAPMVALYRLFLQGEWLELILTSATIDRLFFCVLSGATLMAALLFSVNSYALNTKARHVLNFICQIWLLSFSILLSPAASVDLLGLFAVPCTLLLPVLFIRIHYSIARILYPLLVAAAVVSLFLR